MVLLKQYFALKNTKTPQLLFALLVAVIHYPVTTCPLRGILFQFYILCVHCCTVHIALAQSNVFLSTDGLQSPSFFLFSFQDSNAQIRRRRATPKILFAIALCGSALTLARRIRRSLRIFPALCRVTVPHYSGKKFLIV